MSCKIILIVFQELIFQYISVPSELFISNKKFSYCSQFLVWWYHCNKSKILIFMFINTIFKIVYLFFISWLRFFYIFHLNDYEQYCFILLICVINKKAPCLFFVMVQYWNLKLLELKLWFVVLPSLKFIWND